MMVQNGGRHFRNSVDMGQMKQSTLPSSPQRLGSNQLTLNAMMNIPVNGKGPVQMFRNSIKLMREKNIRRHQFNHMLSSAKDPVLSQY